MATEEERKHLEAAKDSKLWRALRIATRTRFSKLDRMEPGKSLRDVFVAEKADTAKVPTVESQELDVRETEVEVA